MLELRRDSYPATLDLDELRIRFARNPRFSLDTDVVVAERDGRLIASLVALPLRCYAPGSGLPLPLCGIASVAVHPLARRRGVAGNLVRHGLQLARQRGDCLAALFSFEYAFYARLGFAPVVRAQRFRCQPQHLPDFPERDRLISLGPADATRLADCYTRLESASKRLILERSPAYWLSLLETPGLRAYGLGDPLEGYLLYQYRAFPDQPLSSEVEVLELLADRPASWRALMGLLHCLQDQVLAVDLPADCLDPLPLLWKEQKQRDSRMVRGEDYTVGESTVGMMLRWLNPAQCLSLRGYPPVDADYRLDVRDEWQGRLLLRAGQPQLSEPGGSGPWLRADAGTWAQIWSGAVSPSRAAWWGRLEAPEDRLAELDALFAGPPPYTHELDCF